jgi:hypothetical protein
MGRNDMLPNNFMSLFKKIRISLMKNSIKSYENGFQVEGKIIDTGRKSHIREKIL